MTFLHDGPNESNVCQALPKLRQIALIVALLGLGASLSHAGTWVPFGPQTYVQSSGSATVVTNSFSVLNPNTLYVLKINNGGLNGQFPRSTGVITLNGVRIVGPRELNPRIPILLWPVLLRSNNQLAVELQGTTGSGILLQIIGLDLGNPSISGTISPAANSAGWNKSNVTVSFTCSDKTSGVASCPSPTLLTNEGANQVVSGTVTDKAGNKATTSVTVSLDKTPPTISGTISPPPDAGGWNSPPVTVSFGCSDQLSGTASCSSPVTLTNEGANQLATGTATDIAGNVATAQTTVNISSSFFLIRNYGGKCLDYGQNTRAGGTGLFLNDCALAHPIRVEEINDRHEVILHAGTQVIGVGSATGGIVGGPSPTEYALELQTYNPNPAFAGNQIFALDGDSIILASSRPCANTDTILCPPPPPELVVQIQNAHGANRSPLVAGARHLADSEFWDFNSIDGSRKYPTRGFVEVATNDQLWNRICASPQANERTGAPPPNFDPTRPGNSAPCETIAAGWGTVLMVSSPTRCDHVPGPAPGDPPQDVGYCIDMSAYAPVVLPAGVTLRGGRRGLDLGPQIYAAYYLGKTNYTTKTTDPDNPDGRIANCEWCMLQIHGDYVRITGLRLHGPTRTTERVQETPEGIRIDPIPLQDFASPTEYISLIDHNDISDWVEAGIYVAGGHSETVTCDGVADNEATQANVRIERNFMHHNERQDSGYGAEIGSGGRALISGNTFLMNRHAIAAGGEAHERYRASYNLVLSQAPLQIGPIGGPTNFYTHDFDMHGTGSGGFGGLGGEYLDIVANTFLGTNRHNFEWRGVPCSNHNFSSNISLESTSDALNFKPSGDQIFGHIDYINIADAPNQFEHGNPTNQLAVGDFDGDGIDDLFLATGSAWYYASAGNAEWRFLKPATDTIDQLLFGDFDGDGRTDVVAIHNGQFVISFAGISAWEVLNTDPTSGRLLLLPSAVSSMAVGDFDGDGHADIFYADGATWWLSYGGNSPFAPVNTSSFRRQDVRFGDFDGDGATDVFGVVSNGQFNTWSYSKSAVGLWADGYLQPALTNTVDSLVVADFDGNGRADVAMVSAPDLNFINLDPLTADFTDWNWSFSYDGVQNWQSHQITPTSQCSLSGFSAQQLTASFLVGVGRFDGNPGADVLLWGNDGNNNLCIAPGGTSPAIRQSRQDMR